MVVALFVGLSVVPEVMLGQQHLDAQPQHPHSTQSLYPGTCSNVIL